MPQLTNTFSTYGAIGNREDLIDIITRISPTDTPFYSSVPKGKATNTLHEWQTQDLAAVVTNAQIEGDEATNIAITPTVRLNNRTQISTKTVVVSGTQQSGMDPAGRKDEMAYQITLKGLELKRDVESALCQNTTAVVGNNTTARVCRGLEGWVATNSSVGATGVNPNYITNTAPTDGTARAFTETLLRAGLLGAYNEGGNPDTLMLGPAQKQTFSSFTGGNTRFDISEDKAVTNSVDVYISDFGRIKAVPNRFQRNRTAFGLEMQRWKFCNMRPMFTKDLAETGDFTRKQIIWEWTLESLAEKSGFAVRDLT